MDDGDHIDVALRLGARNAPGDPDLDRASAPVRLTGGQAPPMSDPRVSFDAPIAQDPDMIVGGAFVLPVGTTDLAAQITANFSDVPELGEVAGTFAYTAEVVPPAPAIWQVSAISPGSTVESDGTSHDLDFQLGLLAAETSGSRMLRISATRQSGGPAFTSSVNIPLRQQT
jgi:hypothetical protein